MLNPMNSCETKLWKVAALSGLHIPAQEAFVETVRQLADAFVRVTNPELHKIDTAYARANKGSAQAALEAAVSSDPVFARLDIGRLIEELTAPEAFVSRLISDNNRRHGRAAAAKEMGT